VTVPGLEFELLVPVVLLVVLFVVAFGLMAIEALCPG